MRGLVDTPDLAETWHTFRMVTGSFVLLTSVVLGVMWGWPGGFLCGVLAAAAVADAGYRRRCPGRSPMPSMVLDVTLIGVAMVVVALEPAGIGAPFIYMLVVPAFLLRWTRAWTVMVYAVVWSAVALAGPEVVPLATSVSRETITALAYLIFAGHAVALVVVVSGALDRSRRARDEFLAAVSHEIRTPLTSILGWSRVLQDGSVALGSDEAVEALGLINAEAEEISEIVEDLLVAARLDTGMLEVQPQRVDLGVETRAVLDSRVVTSGKPIRVQAGGCAAVGDRVRVRQIIRNLISNAVRYGGPNVWVTFSTSDSQSVLAVCDDGPDLPTELRERIFEPYVQGGGSRRAPQAIGLGLTVSRNLARLMGGDLRCRRIDNATVFELTLPTAQGADTTIDASLNDGTNPTEPEESARVIGGSGTPRGPATDLDPQDRRILGSSGAVS